MCCDRWRSLSDAQNVITFEAVSSGRGANVDWRVKAVVKNRVSGERAVVTRSRWESKSCCRSKPKNVGVMFPSCFYRHTCGEAESFGQLASIARFVSSSSSSTACFLLSPWYNRFVGRKTPVYLPLLLPPPPHVSSCSSKLIFFFFFYSMLFYRMLSFSCSSLSLSYIVHQPKILFLL